MPRIVAIAALVGAGLGALALRVVLEGRTALGDGDAWMSRGKPAEAIASYEAAARWYLPLARHVDAAYDRLRALTHDDATALAAWRAIRAAALATRTLWTPHVADLQAANIAIAATSARDPAAGSGGGDTVAAREAWHRVRLERNPRPGGAATALAALGIVAWIGGAITLARHGRRERPTLVAVVLGLGLVCWVVGLYNA